MSRVLFFEPYSGHFSGAQIVSLNVVKELNKKFDVDLLTRKKKSAIRKKFKDGVNGLVYDLPFDSLFEQTMGRGDTDSGINISKLGHILKLLILIAGINIYMLFFLLYKKPKYLYFYDPGAFFLCGLISPLVRTKFIWHLHGPINYNRWIRKYIMCCCYKIIVPSLAIKDHVSDFTNCEVIYNGFEFPKLNKKINNPNNNEVVFSFVGTLVPHKGLHKILKALSDIDCVETNIKLNVMGGYHGAYSQYYEDLIDSLVCELPENVEVAFFGWTEPGVIFENLYRSDMLLFSSVIEDFIELNGKTIFINSSEALPTVLIESLALGTPVIATNTPGVSEIVSNGSDGIVLETDSVSDLSSAISRFIKGEVDFLVDVERIRSKFSNEIMNRKINNSFR